MRNSTRSELDPFIVMDVMEAARRAEAAGRRIIHLEVGQPGTGAPRGALAKLGAAMHEAPLGYTVALGLPALRARIAQHYGQTQGIDLDPARVVITAGASGAFLLAFTALFDSGDRVAIGAPGYPSYRQILRGLGLIPVDVPTQAQNRYQPVPADLPEGLAGLLVASPGNPTGTMLDAAGLGALIDAARARELAFISDEIYHGIEYETKAVSALALTDQAYVINSFSKYFSMTGWRIGWMVVPPGATRRVERIAQNFFICPAHAAQLTALAAMDCTDELEANLAVYARNRALMMAGLPQAGFTTLAPPDGAFYIYADVSAITDDARALASEILDRAGVAVTPGTDFDPVRGHHFLRFSYAARTADIEEGLERLTRFMASN